LKESIVLVDFFQCRRDVLSQDLIVFDLVQWFPTGEEFPLSI